MFEGTLGTMPFLGRLWSVQDGCGSISGLVDGEVAHAAVVDQWTAAAEAGRAPAVGMKDLVLLSYGPSASRIRGSEQCDAGYPEAGREVHGSGVVGDQQAESAQDRCQVREIEVGSHNGVDLAGLLVDPHRQPEFLGPGDEDDADVGPSASKATRQRHKPLPGPSLAGSELSTGEEADNRG